ncbi:3288_t:CDS:2 [Acaulospora morrowiae]|uniref:Tethering factor for nuclear proteasome STS1 n=1 Tax=Acaulospora morrowiae TaxID=94023 RepID=A0A9N9AJP1_9GLOM|nr:3288_t:CDS:2 [Acaulospora morrowiae]
MNNNSPCFPLARNHHQPSFFHPNNALHPIHASQRLSYRERHAAAIVSEGSTKVTGKRKPGDESDDSMSESKSPPCSPRLNGHTHEMEATVKRAKLSNEKEFPLSKLLGTLDKPQLLSLINNLIDAHPNLQSEIASNIPRPTIQSVTRILEGMEKKYLDSFPYTKWGSSKDDYSFNRVKPAIMELQGAIMDYADHFTSPEEFPTVTFAFLHLATTITHRLPEWDNSSHNELKRDIYLKLADYWKKAIHEASSKLRDGKIYGHTVVNEWAKNLAQHNRDSNGAFQQASEEFVEKLGVIIGLQGGVSGVSASSLTFSFASGIGGMNSSNNSMNHRNFQLMSA